MKRIYLDESCIGTVIRDEGPYVKLLSVPKQEDGQWTAVAQVDGTLAIIALTVLAATQEGKP